MRDEVFVRFFLMFIGYSTIGVITMCIHALIVVTKVLKFEPRDFPKYP